MERFCRRYPFESFTRAAAATSVTALMKPAGAGTSEAAPGSGKANPIAAPAMADADFGASLADQLLPHPAFFGGACPLSAADRERLASTVVVRANGAKVLEAKSHPFACSAGEIYVGSNPVGGSTCSARFTGSILSSERIGILYLR